MKGYTTREVAEVLGLPTSKILSWTRSGLVTPQRNSRGAYLFSFQDLVLLRTARDLLAQDVPARRVSEALEALLSREQLSSTGVGMNVAIPHVKWKGIDRVICSLCGSRAGIDWNAIDGEPVHILFIVLRPERATDSHDPEHHIERMSWIARLGRQSDFRNCVQNVNTKAEMLGLLKEMSPV